MLIENLTTSQINGWRSSKDKQAISNEVTKSYYYQVAMCKKLERLYQGHNFQYPESQEEERGDSFDLKIDNLTVELECGTTQSKWDSVLGMYPYWKYGLNVLTRKCVEGRWDIFIKYNTKLNSFFALTYPFLMEVGKIKEGISHSLGYNTNNNVISVAWEDIVNDPAKMVYDDFGLLIEMFNINAKP